MSHTEWTERLDALRSGELAADETAEMREHLLSCLSCRSTLKFIETLAAHGPDTYADARGAAPLRARLGDGFGVVETRIGSVWVAFTARGDARLVDLDVGKERLFEARYRRRYGRMVFPEAVPAKLAESVQKAVSGEPIRSFRADTSLCSPFQQRVLEAARSVPRGEVRPYLWIARRIRMPRAARAVGTALATNPLPLLIPCHRVTPSAGGLGGYVFGARAKRALLEGESVPVAELARLERDRVRFIGCESTGVYCYPTCHHIRRAKPENRTPFRSEKAASGAGFRPCRRCAPAAA